MAEDPWQKPTKVALQRAKELFPDGQGFLLEEVDRTSSGHWIVTISFDHPALSSRAFNLPGFAPIKERLYRQFELDSLSKEVLRMKARNVP
jgi:hypothetical protein